MRLGTQQKLYHLKHEQDFLTDIKWEPNNKHDNQKTFWINLLL